MSQVRGPAGPGQQAARAAVPAGGHQHVLQQGEPGEDTGQLERAAQAEAEDLLRGRAGDAAAAEVDLAGVGPLVAGHDVEQGGLAGPVRPDQAGDRAFRHGQRAAVERLHAAEGLGDLIGPQLGGHGRYPLGPGWAAGGGRGSGPASG